MSKQKIEVELEVPEGWELTGEYRVPNAGEMYLYIASGLVLKCLGVVAEKFIVRRVWSKQEAESSMDRVRGLIQLAEVTGTHRTCSCKCCDEIRRIVG
jgi:hypothetical protein